MKLTNSIKQAFVRSREIIVRARNAIEAQASASAVTGRGVGEVCRLEEVA